MDLPTNFIEKYRPRRRQIGTPRTQREDLIQQFLDRLNPDQLKDGRKPYTYGQMAKRFQGLTDQRLYQLFQECSSPTVKSFGAMMTYKLKQI